MIDKEYPKAGAGGAIPIGGTDISIRPPNQDLVVIGASAGGIEALSRLVATLPPDFPAPVVIAQHLEPSRVSHLRDILGRRSTLPVRSVDEHEVIASGVVYVVPANRDVEITDHAISLRRDQP